MVDETPEGSERRTRRRFFKKALAYIAAIAIAVIATVIGAAIVGEGRFAVEPESPTQTAIAETTRNESSTVTPQESTSSLPTESAEPATESPPPEGTPRPLGSAGADGVLDEQTNRRDAFAVQLTAAEPVQFRAMQTNECNGHISLALYGPSTTSIDDPSLAEEQAYMGMGDSVTLRYTPALTGVYFVVLETQRNGVAYRLDAQGAIAAPDAIEGLPPSLE